MNNYIIVLQSYRVSCPIQFQYFDIYEDDVIHAGGILKQPDHFDIEMNGGVGYSILQIALHCIAGSKFH